MDPTWLAALKAAVTQIKSIKRYWLIAVNFVKRVWSLDELREAKQIENMTKYLEAVAKTLAVMKKSGVPEDEIRQLALELNVPLIQANLEAMIIARGLPRPEAARQARPHATAAPAGPSSIHARSTAGSPRTNPSNGSADDGAHPTTASDPVPPGSSGKKDGSDQSTEGAVVPGP